MTESELLKLKKKVDEAKQTSAELKGHQTALFKQLKEDWDCTTIEEAEQRIKTMSKEVDKLTEQIETGMEELETYEV
jgi:uncharacterized protein YaaN involved in tellurite resistance